MNKGGFQTKTVPAGPQYSAPRRGAVTATPAQGAGTPNQAEVVARLLQLGASERVIELAKKAIKVVP